MKLFKGTFSKLRFSPGPEFPLCPPTFHPNAHTDTQPVCGERHRQRTKSAFSDAPPPRPATSVTCLKPSVYWVPASLHQPAKFSSSESGEILPLVTIQPWILGLFAKSSPQAPALEEGLRAGCFATHLPHLPTDLHPHTALLPLLTHPDLYFWPLSAPPRNCRARQIWGTQQSEGAPWFPLPLSPHSH